MEGGDTTDPPLSGGEGCKCPQLSNTEGGGVDPPKSPQFREHTLQLPSFVQAFQMANMQAQ